MITVLALVAGESGDWANGTIPTISSTAKHKVRTIKGARISARSSVTARA
jgi:hypothetical protein